ncbi:MAG: hypothetical protein WB627_18965 [Candidatus Acidiferrum sp.]
MTGEEKSAPGNGVCTTAENKERFLSPQADTFPAGPESSIAGANVKEKASACSVRNDGFVAGPRVPTNDGFVAGPRVPTNGGFVAER